MHQNEISKLTAAQFLAKVTPRAPINFNDNGGNFFHMRRGLERLRNLIGHRSAGGAGMELAHSLMARGVKKVWVSLECPDLLHRNDAGRRDTIKELKALIGDNKVIPMASGVYYFPSGEKKFPDIDSFAEFGESSTEKPFFFLREKPKMHGRDISGEGASSVKKHSETIDTDFLDHLARQEATFTTINGREFMSIHRGKHRGPAPALPYQVAPFHFKDDLLEQYSLLPDIANVNIGKTMAIPDQTQSGHWYKGRAKDDNPSADVVHPTVPLPEGHEYYGTGAGIGIRKIEDKK